MKRLITSVTTSAMILLAMFLHATPASAHELSSSYLSVSLEEEQIKGYWLVQPEDMHLAVTLDSNKDGNIVWQEIQSRSASISSYFQDNVKLIAGERQCAIETGNVMLENRSSKTFLYLPLSGVCNSSGEIEIQYQPFFENDQSHRGILQAAINDNNTSTVFSPLRTDFTVSIESTGIWQSFRIFIIEGIWHIWIGLDHILFLVALLFSGQKLSANNRQHLHKTPWTETLKYRSADILKTVTAFTVAHSITLILGTLGLVALPGVLVETIIALSVAISGANVIFHFLDRIRWWFIFGFGLIHGLGFASVLGDLLTTQGVRLSSLLGFNIGVEVGQLCIVAVALPLIVALERRSPWNVIVTRLVGTGIGLTGLYWAISRAIL